MCLYLKIKNFFKCKDIYYNKNIYISLLLTERHIISRSDKRWKRLDELCYLSKNLYNSALYLIKQEFLTSGKWIRYNDMDKLIKKINPEPYRAFPAGTSQQILINLDQNLKSYFESIKAWKRDNKKFTGCPTFPKFKDSKKGRNIVTMTVFNARHKENHILFSKQLKLENLITKTKSLRQVRIVPASSCIIIEVIYEKQEIVKEILNNNWLSIDLGINNLATCTSNVAKSLIINGKPLKSINQFYNKKLAKLKSDLGKRNKKKHSKKISRLTLKRNNKINDYFHKISRYIIKYCITNNIDNIVVGYNENWKQNVNLGKRNNQSFVQIPYASLLQKFTYKAQLQGLNISTQEESYTSKCSALDLEAIQFHEFYVGQRTKRGMFVTSSGQLLNADVNGSLNILRKKVASDEFLTPACRGLVFNPVKINFH